VFFVKRSRPSFGFGWGVWKKQDAVPPDETAPTLTSPTDAADGSDGATLAVTTDEAGGTLYWFISTSATPPSAANLKAGTGAVAYGDEAVTGTGVQNVAVPSGLTAETEYFAHFLHRDAAGNDSAIATGDGFTTEAEAEMGAPVATLTSDAGDPPEVDLTFGADIFAGYYLRIERSTDGVNDGDGGYTTATLDILHQITSGEIAAGEITNADLTADGYVDPTGTWYQQYRFERGDGEVSPWSNELTGTVTASVATWNPTTGVNKNTNLTLSNGNLTALSTLQGAAHGVRATVAASGHKVFETTLDDWRNSDSSAFIGVGVIDSAQDLSSATIPGDTGIPGAMLRLNDRGTSCQRYANGTNTTGISVPGGTLANGDIIRCVFDTAANTVEWFVIRSGALGTATSISSVTLTTSDITGDWYAFGSGYRNGDQFTTNFGATAFAAAALPSGATAYG
jgi:hypothetical protein